MARIICRDAKLATHTVMEKLQHPGSRNGSRCRHRNLVQNRGHNQRHEGARHAVSGAVKEHQIVDMTNRLDGIEVAPNKILWLPDHMRLAKVAVQLFLGWQNAALDRTGIGNRVTKIPVGLGKLTFLFLDLTDVDANAAISLKFARIINHWNATDADMDRLSVNPAKFIFESAEFTARLQISKMVRKLGLRPGLHRNILTGAANHIIRLQPGDLEKIVREKAEAKLGIHFEKPVTRYFSQFAEPLFTFGKLHL